MNVTDILFDILDALKHKLYSKFYIHRLQNDSDSFLTIKLFVNSF